MWYAHRLSTPQLQAAAAVKSPMLHMGQDTLELKQHTAKTARCLDVGFRGSAGCAISVSAEQMAPHSSAPHVRQRMVPMLAAADGLHIALTATPDILQVTYTSSCDTLQINAVTNSPATSQFVQFGVSG
eukprot:GHRR01010050.1.p1 GENE.GHRR01010050.1~~GHRR01010050.1.p1  ORF type:complete len:129 (+),score=33.39 GHRR01010050.1:802-1188(+)